MYPMKSYKSINRNPLSLRQHGFKLHISLGRFSALSNFKLLIGTSHLHGPLVVLLLGINTPPPSPPPTPTCLYACVLEAKSATAVVSAGHGQGRVEQLS